MPIRHCNYTKFYCKNQMHAVVELLHNDYGKGGEQVDEKLEQRAGEITVAVKLSGLDEQIAKANELVETIRKARSLADDLAKGINSIELEL